MKCVENNNKDLNSIIKILDNETKWLVNRDTSIYENFKREYTIFIKMLYDRLKEGEKRCLDYLRIRLGDSVLSFGTDEFTCEYRGYSEILAKIDEALGHGYNPDRYANPLVMFRNMYNDFFSLIGGNPNSKENLEQFAELTKRCLERIGFDKVKSNCFMGALIFEVDNCSRIVKAMDALYEEQRRYKQKNPTALIVTDEYTIKEYVEDYLDNWFKNQVNNFDNDTTAIRLKWNL